MSDDLVERLLAEAISTSFHEEGYIEGVSDPGEWNEFLAAARTCLDQLAANDMAVVGWQPIDTAPKDGTWVLVAGGNWDVAMAWFALNPRTNLAYWKRSEEWDDYDLADDQPTHWMPLPAPPQTQKRPTHPEGQAGKSSPRQGC